MHRPVAIAPTAREPVVGQQPILLEYRPCYTTELARPHEVRPRITGWAHARGRRTWA